MNTRTTLTIAAALLVAAMFAPVPAFAAEATTLAELTSQATSATVDAEKATTDLSTLEAELAAARAELAAIESRLPSTPREELRAVALAVGAAFSSSLAERAEATAADMRQRDQLQTDIDRMEAEHDELVAEAEEKREDAEALQKKLEQAQVEAAAAAAAEAERVRAERAPHVRLVIDPGHGGKDPGAVSGNIYEKNTSLAISRLVYDAAVRQGWNVLMTRNSDVFVPLNQRPAMAAGFGATAFVSIHSNSYGPVPKGNMTIYRSGQGAALGQKIMNQMAPLTDYSDIGNVSDSRGLAVLRGATMPATLVEVMSLSAPAEVEALVNPEVQSRYAEAIVKGVAEYHGISYVPPATAAPAPAPEQTADATVAAEQSEVTSSADESKVDGADAGAGVGSGAAATSNSILNELFRLLVG